MANTLEYVLKLNNDEFKHKMHEAEEAVEKIDEGFEKLRETALELAGITAGLEFLKETVEDFQDMEKATAQLNFNVGARGGLQSELAELHEQSEALGKTTFFNPKEITKAQDALLNYGVGIEDVSKSIKTLSDVGLAKGKSLEDIGGTIASASASGRARALREYGLGFLQLETDMSVAGAEARNYTIIIDAMAKKYAGATEQMKNTSFFQLKKLKDEFEEMKELIGERVIKVFLNFINLIKEHSDTIINLGKAFLVYKGTLLAVTYLFPILSGEIEIAKSAMIAFNLVAEANPFVLLASAAAALVLGLLQLEKAYDDLNKQINREIDNRIKLQKLNEVSHIKEETEAIMKKTGAHEAEARAIALKNDIANEGYNQIALHQQIEVAQKQMKAMYEKHNWIGAGSQEVRDAEAHYNEILANNRELITNSMARQSQARQLLAQKIENKEPEKTKIAKPADKETVKENLTINIAKMIEHFDLHTVTLKEGSQEIKSIIQAVMQEAVTSVRYLKN